MTHGLAHACVCAAVLFAWALPGGPGVARRAGAASELEIDAALSRAASAALGPREGTILVMDAQTGRLRAAAGARIAFEEATPPGSAVKPFTTLAALRAGAVTEESRHRCPGKYERGALTLNCAHARHLSPFDARQALANSCNHFFGLVGEALDGAAFARTLEEFGFGQPTRGGDGASEAAGAVPRAAVGVAEMLGESERVRVTPAQMLSAYAAIFNGGRLFVPRLAPPEGFTPSERVRLDIKPAHRALVAEGVRGAVAYGTAARAGLSTLPVQVFGKTGTSTPPGDFRPQGWFVGLSTDGADDSKVAPPERVRLAVLVFLKRGHGSDAARLARPVFEEYARTLARRDEAAQVNGESVKDSTQDSSEGDDADAEGDAHGDERSGPFVRVRLAREDSTLTLALEDYVFGVLAAEGSVEDEPEALKALAVVARAYALRNLRRHARDRFDLCDSTHCQRYMPVRGEAARPEFYELLRRVVRETTGEVLLGPGGRVAESYFSAACGGATADIRRLWGAREAPPHLRGVRDEACAASPTWTDVVRAEDLLRALRADPRGDVGARLDAVRVLKRDAGGRAEVVELSGERRRVLSGWDFKIIVGRTLGWNVLKSSRFEAARAGRDFVFRGRGFGHGLGLCQAGAHTLAARGATYRQILAHYLPGVGVGQAERLRIADSSDCGSRIADCGLQTDERQHDSQVRFHTASFDASGDEHQFTVAPAVFHSAIRNPQSAISKARVSLAGEHFRVSYPARVARREVEAALRMLEAARAELARRLESASLGAAAPTGVEVFVHETTGDFVGVTGEPAWVAAATRGRRVELQPLGVLRRRGVLAPTLRHELVHVACDAIGRGRAPRWLVEGLAVHVAGEGPSLARSAPASKLSLAELEQRLARPGSAEEMRALYAAAHREVAALIRREGEAAAWRRVAGGR